VATQLVASLVVLSSIELASIIQDIALGGESGFGLKVLRISSSSPCTAMNFHFSTSSRLALGPTQPPCPTGTKVSFPGSKAGGA
jgi:hypothetical protein